jgi:hypothetical protein
LPANDGIVFGLLTGVLPAAAPSAGCWVCVHASLPDQELFVDVPELVLPL